MISKLSESTPQPAIAMGEDCAEVVLRDLRKTSRDSDNEVGEDDIGGLTVVVILCSL